MDYPGFLKALVNEYHCFVYLVQSYIYRRVRLVNTPCVIAHTPKLIVHTPAGIAHTPEPKWVKEGKACGKLSYKE